MSPLTVSIKTRQSRHQHQGSVLIVVLVVIALLTLGAYSFSELMVSESLATGVFGREAQARACADSGVDLAAAILGQVSEEAVYDNVLHDPQHFAGVTLRESDSPRGRARFSLVAPNESDVSASTIRFGLIDESSKLNLNALISDEKKQSQQNLTVGTSSGTGASGTGSSTSGGSSGASSSSSSATSSTTASSPSSRLLMIPGMTDELADAILDFIDDDETPRTNGCESEYYESLQAPYSSKNSPLESLDELLLVRGVTAEMLYGEDVNRNGLLDPNENDGDASWPPDNQDGLLLLGWSSYLTVFSREKNLQFDNSPRININDNNLADLYDKLEQTFDANVAQFVVAYRATGGQNANNNSGAGGNNSGSGGKSGGASGSSPSTSNLSGMTASQQAQQLQQAAKALGNAIGGGNGTVTRAGLDLTQGGTRQVQSLYELIGATVQATVNGSPQTLQSPWSASGSDMAGYLPQLLDTLTTSNDEYVEGRINILQARPETLLTIPGMTESLADAILAARLGPDGTPNVDFTGARATTGWLVIENLTDLNTMIALDRYLTVRSGVHRVQSVGYFDEAGPYSRLEAVIDFTEVGKPPRIVSLKDLSDLGRGYTPTMLLGSSQ